MRQIERSKDRKLHVLIRADDPQHEPHWNRELSTRRITHDLRMPETPVWQLVFVKARLFFVASDDVPAEATIEATRDINRALEAGWKGLDIAEIVPLDQIARAHELVEHRAKPGRVIVAI